MNTLTTTPAAPPSEVHALLEQRDQLRGWLERLRTVDDGTPARIAERVRADYTVRLEALTGEIGRHAAALETELAELRTSLGRAEAGSAEAGDTLAEARLRHRIGEIAADAWEERRAALEAAATRAEAEVAEARAAVGRLAELVGEIGMGTAPLPPLPPLPAPAADEQTQPPAEPAEAVPVEQESGEPVSDDLPFLQIDDETTTEQAAPAPEEDLAFLEELDRAIAASMGSESAVPAAAGGAVGSSVACRECGSGNDAQAWYCEICGSEL